MTFGLAMGLLAAACWGITDIVAALGGRRFGVFVTLAASQVTGLVVLASLALINGGLSVPEGIATMALAYGLMLAVGYLGMFAGLTVGPVSVVSPTIAAYGGLIVILAVVILDERVAPTEWLGAAAATVGVALVALRIEAADRRVHPVSRGVAYAVVAVLLFASASVGIADLVRQVGWLDVAVLNRMASATVAVALVVGIARARPRSDSLFRPPLRRPGARGWAPLLLVGLLDVAGVIAFGVGLESSPAWIVGLASSFSPAVAVLVAVLVLREHLRTIQWIGLAAILGGLILIGLPADDRGGEQRTPPRFTAWRGTAHEHVSRFDAVRGAGHG
jgi:drug/metabolite transporter (DMT)-like permease